MLQTYYVHLLHKAALPVYLHQESGSERLLVYQNHNQINFPENDQPDTDTIIQAIM